MDIYKYGSETDEDGTELRITYLFQNPFQDRLTLEGTYNREKRELGRRRWTPRMELAALKIRGSLMASMVKAIQVKAMFFTDIT